MLKRYSGGISKKSLEDYITDMTISLLSADYSNFDKSNDRQLTNLGEYDDSIVARSQLARGHVFIARLEAL